MLITSISNKHFQSMTTLLLLFLDAVLISLAYLLAYQLRIAIAFPTEPRGLESVTAYGRVILVQVICIQIVFYLNRLYHGTRTIGRVDRAYAVFSAVSVGALFSIAFSTLLFKNTVFEVDYSRTIVLYAWVLTIALVLLGRSGYSGILADHTPVYCASCKGRISTHGLDRDLKVDLSEVAEETGRFRDPTNPY